MKLVEDYRSAWKWFSIHAMAAALALEGAMTAIPEWIKHYLPDALMHAAAIILLVLGVGGRLVEQGKKPDGSQ